MNGQNKSLTGFEMEMFLLNKNGKIVGLADELVRKANKDGNTSIKKESFKNLIEAASLPSESVVYSMTHLLDDLEYLISIAKKKGLFLCPLGTYPGTFKPELTNDKRYKVKEAILGKNRFTISGRCAGFHMHYTLPRGIFDEELRLLRLIAHQKTKDSLVNSYNLLVACDPALTCFMQSSPFYQGKYLGKDSRMIMYRGGKYLENMAGLYANLSEFGGLPHYKLTIFDMEEIVYSNFEKWKAYLKGLGYNIKTLSLFGSMLDLNWAPVKINPNGTLEQRGMDMNHPFIIAGVGVIIKFMLKKLQEESYTIVPSEIGIKDPFKTEKDVIYVPPFSYVRNILQKESAYRGFESEAVRNYCKKMLKFSLIAIPKNRLKIIEPIEKMLCNKKTMSDEILDYVRAKGFGTKEITNKLAAEVALEHSQRLEEQIPSLREMLKIN